MNQIIKKISLVVLASALVAPITVLAQKDKEEKKEKKEAEVIIITRKDAKDDNDKMVIELNGDKVIVNGKPVDGKDGNVTVKRNKIKDVWAYGFGHNGNNNFAMLDMDEDRAMLGVTTEKADNGAEIQTVSKESGAEKAGLKKADIITKIDDKKISTPDDLSVAIKAHKPGDKVSITYLREGKEQKIIAELGKWKGVRTYAPGAQNFNDFRLALPNMDFEHLPGMESLPRLQGQAWNWSRGGPRLGVSVQDTEDGKGVKVINVDEDGNGSKAGIKEDDILTEVDGKSVNSADEVAKIIKESKDKTSVKIKLLRNGKTENLEVKIPRKLKKADL